MFSRNEIDLNQLSFGISAGLIQSQLDETKFRQSGFDPIINGTIVQKIHLMLILVPLIISWIYMCMEQSKCSRN
jgi:hypothetical protein